MAIILLLLSLFSQPAPAMISASQCGIFDDYLSHQITAEKACNQGGGSYCNNGKNDGDTLCRGLGGPSGLCANVQNLAQGYCMIIGESYCDKVEASAASTYEAKIKSKCRDIVKNLLLENAALKAKAQQ